MSVTFGELLWITNKIYIIHSDRQPVWHSVRGVKRAVRLSGGLSADTLPNKIYEERIQIAYSLFFISFIWKSIIGLADKEKGDDQGHVSAASYHNCHFSFHSLVISFPFDKARCRENQTHLFIMSSFYLYIHLTFHFFLIAVKWDLSFCMQGRYSQADGIFFPCLFSFTSLFLSSTNSCCDYRS